jgi:hypothetical protein
VPPLSSGAILSPGDRCGTHAEGEKIMFNASLRWIPLAVAAMVATASPLAAQQTTPDGQAAPQQPPTDLAPPVPRSSTELPPPFPHYPARKPREHDPNYHPGKHRAAHAQSSHRSKATHHVVKAHHQAKTSHRAAPQRQAKRQYFSKRTIRQCRAMSYKQIMAHRYCRTMMKQELAAQPTHHAQHRKAAHSSESRRHRR